MSLRPGPGVELFTGEHAQHLSHPLAPFRSEGAALATPASLAALYLREVSPIYGIGNGVELRPAGEKTLAGVSVIAFAQLHRALRVNEAGVTVNILHDPLRVTSSYSTVDRDVRLGRLPAADDRYALRRVNAGVLRVMLGLDEGTVIEIDAAATLIHRYDPAARLDPDRPIDPTDPSRVLVPGGHPTPRVAEVPVTIRAGDHYVVTEVLATLGRGGLFGVTWRLLIEVETGAVLFVRPLVASATGCVFVDDPVTLTGDATLSPCTAGTTLDALASQVSLPGLHPMDGPQSLTGEIVRLQDVHPPPFGPPVSAASPPSFVYGARTPEFAAVSAYYHCDAVFRMLERWGLPPRVLLPRTRLPVTVDHREESDVNAWVYVDGDNGGVWLFTFGRGRFRCPDGQEAVGIVADRRVVLHEFCHALIQDATGRLTLGFAHSAGDSLAAILSDPGSRAPDRGDTYPWLRLGRRHDRAAAKGWAWGGTGKGQGEYGTDQMLATTLFRAYRVAGGDSDSPPERQRAAESIARLIVRAIWSLSRVAPPSMPEQFATALMEADLAGPDVEGQPGGTLHKVLRWAFEQQGLYQPPATPAGAATGPGAPPDVDVHIAADDGYVAAVDGPGGYTWSGEGIWNRHAPDSRPGHQPPRPEAVNHVYVTVRNRGTRAAAGTVVRAFRCDGRGSHAWPTDWYPLLTPEVRISDPIGPGGAVTAGPFAWRPDAGDHVCVLAYVSAAGDASNADPDGPVPCARGPIPAVRLARLDNNVAVRRMGAGPTADG